MVSHLVTMSIGDGTADVKLGHVIDSLNKLDVGLEEKILLSSTAGRGRGGGHQGLGGSTGTGADSILIVSYADLSRLVATSFHELLQSSATNSNYTPRSVDASRARNVSMSSPIGYMSPAFDRQRSTESNASVGSMGRPTSSSPSADAYGLLRPIPTQITPGPPGGVARALPFGVAGSQGDSRNFSEIGMNYKSPPVSAPPASSSSPSPSATITPTRQY